MDVDYYVRTIFCLQLAVPLRGEGVLEGVGADIAAGRGDPELGVHGQLRAVA